MIDAPDYSYDISRPQLSFCLEVISGNVSASSDIDTGYDDLIGEINVNYRDIDETTTILREILGVRRILGARGS